MQLLLLNNPASNAHTGCFSEKKKLHSTLREKFGRVGREIAREIDKERGERERETAIAKLSRTRWLQQRAVESRQREREGEGEIKKATRNRHPLLKIPTVANQA